MYLVLGLAMHVLGQIASDIGYGSYSFISGIQGPFMTPFVGIDFAHMGIHPPNSIWGWLHPAGRQADSSKVNSSCGLMPA